MTSPTRARSGPRRRAIGAATALLLLITGLAFATAPSASARVAPVTDGGLDWGVRESFRNYINALGADGAITVAGGATVNPDGTFHFPADTTAGFDATAATPTATFKGSVRFTGHAGALDITISNIRVRHTGTTGTDGVLIANVVSTPYPGGGAPVTSNNLQLATLSGGTYTTAAAGASWTGAASALTSGGASVFSPFYAEGAAFDPVTFSLTFPADATGNLLWALSEQAWNSTSLHPARAAGAPAVLGNDRWGFPATGVTYDPATKATSLDLDGSLTIGNFVQGNYRIVLDNPSITVDADGAGSLSADVSYCTVSCGAVGEVFSTPVRAVVATFTLDDSAVVDTGSHVSWTVTPDFPLQGDPAFPERRQFPQSFLDALAPAQPSLLGHFRETGANQGAKAPAPISVAFDYTPAPPEGVYQQITTEVLENGALTISVDDTTVVLPSSTLSPDGTTLLTTGAINPVTVTDLRLGNPGWSAHGQVGDFTGSAGTIDGRHLGWSPHVVSQSAGQTVTPGGIVVAGVGDGLKASSTLGSSPAGASRGTAVFGGGLELRAPTTTPPGTYTATLTLTVI